MDNRLLKKTLTLLRKNSKLGRIKLAKELGISTFKANEYLAIAKYILKKESESFENILANHIKRIKIREDRDQKYREYLFNLLYQYVQEFEPPRVQKLSEKDSNKFDETIVIALSDTHFGEVVDPNKISGINKYNIKIAAARLEYYVERIVRIVKLHRNFSNINHAVVWLGGDIVSGNIHEELIESNDLSALKQVALAGYLIAQFLAELSTVFKNITVVTTVGNHGRLSKKKKYKYHSVENLDYLVYQIAGFALTKYENIEFYIDESLFKFVDIEGWRFVFSHGDETKSWMNIPFYGLRRDYTAKQSINILVQNEGNLTSPVQPVNYKVVGHFHVAGEIPDNFGSIIMNGSLKGMDEYSFGNGWVTFPMQKIFGVHKDHGKTWSYDIRLSDDLINRDYPERYSVDIPDLWASMEIKDKG